MTAYQFVAPSDPAANPDSSCITKLYQGTAADHCSPVSTGLRVAAAAHSAASDRRGQLNESDQTTGGSLRYALKTASSCARGGSSITPLLTKIF